MPLELLERGSRHHRRLEELSFDQLRRRLPISALVNSLSLAPITTETGLELPWDTHRARHFVCDCAQHMLASAGEHDPRLAACIDTARQYADGLCTAEELERARQEALAASRSRGVSTAAIALAVAECAVAPALEGWPARALYLYRCAAAEVACDAALAELIEPDAQPHLSDDEAELRSQADLDQRLERIRVHAQQAEQRWQGQRLLAVLSVTASARW